MKEYTILSVLGVFISVLADLFLKTKLILNKKFWIFWAVMFVLIFIVNGYLTWRPVVIYGENFYLGLRLFTIPIEDFLFGFSLLTLNIVLWEYYNKKWVKK
ncbi:MAG: lycopene cyclase domain-containing protein [Chlorobi bacterium]|nr:lycopene cyclase domain-containing protein [Chlorobiota bacterium]MCI0716499.1 lycopene cyclase domain-containing protein [Chlorobiota bacterium]